MIEPLVINRTQKCQVAGQEQMVRNFSGGPHHDLNEATPVQRLLADSSPRRCSPNRCRRTAQLTCQSIDLAAGKALASPANVKSQSMCLFPNLEISKTLHRIASLEQSLLAEG